MGTVTVRVLAQQIEAVAGVAVSARILVGTVLAYQHTMGKVLVRNDPRTGQPGPDTVFVSADVAARWVQRWVDYAAGQALKALERDP